MQPVQMPAMTPSKGVTNTDTVIMGGGGSPARTIPLFPHRSQVQTPVVSAALLTVVSGVHAKDAARLATTVTRLYRAMRAPGYLTDAGRDRRALLFAACPLRVTAQITVKCFL